MASSSSSPSFVFASSNGTTCTTSNNNHTNHNNNTVQLLLLSSPPPPPPPPSGQSLSLVSALSNPENHELHIQAIRARDDALSSNMDNSYSLLCLQLCYVMIGCDNPNYMLSNMLPNEFDVWKQTDMISVMRLQQDPTLWIPFGQMAGLILKNALLRPPSSIASSSTNYNGDNNNNNNNNNNMNNIDPSTNKNNATFYLHGHEIVHHMQNALLYALQCHHKELRDVASTIIATTSVSNIHIQPALHISSWPTLVPYLIHILKQRIIIQQQSSTTTPTTTIIDHNNNNNRINNQIEGAFSTIRKMMEDGPNEFTMEQLDQLIPVLLWYISPNNNNTTTTIGEDNNNNNTKVSALQIICSCLVANIMPNTLVVHFNDYLQSLSLLAADNSTTSNHTVRKWVCRSIVILLESRTEYIREHLPSVARFMLETTASCCVMDSSSSNGNSNNNNEQKEIVALEACDFWLTFASLDESIISDSNMLDVIAALLPQLIPVLVRNMVYNTEKQIELLKRNEIEEKEPDNNNNNTMKPIFHKSKSATAHNHSLTSTKKDVSTTTINDDDNVDDDDDDGDYDYDDTEDDGNEWTLRKCAAASLDSLANLYGGEIILPCLLPALQDGLTNGNPWIQEASILALGAIAEGCQEEMTTQNHMTQIHPYLLSLLAMSSDNDGGASGLPQVKCIAAWTIGQYATWAVEQVQNGTQGNLLAKITEIFLTRLTNDKNRKVQFACCAAFGVIIEAAGDLMAPYLEHIYHGLVSALRRYHGRSLLTLFDVIGIMADCCGPAIAEKNLPSLYVPPLLRMWDGFAKHDPTDRTLLPLMECLASIAVTCGMNYQPFALESFENAMFIIEQVTLLLTACGEHIENEADVDPIICATDLLDGLVEGLSSSFATLLSSSHRYGPQFLNVLLSLCQHDIGGVRMSALALMGDLARHAPIILEPALPQLLNEAVASMDPVNPTVAANAVWSIGEICTKCEGNPAPLEPFAPAILRNLIGLLMGNGVDGYDRGTDLPGLAENAAACVGRLAKVSPNFVARDFSRFLLGWCDGMAKISDPTERRDAFQGFVQVVYANPQAIQEATANVSDAIASILFAILTWHIPSDIPANEISTALFTGEYTFQPFPAAEAELGVVLGKLIHDIKSSVGDETWYGVEKKLPVNVRRLLREAYQL